MRVAVAVIILLACCLFDAWQRFSETLDVYPTWGKVQEGDIITLAAPRFEAIRSQLPSSGVIGYEFYGQLPPRIKKVSLAQYHLAPLIVEAAESQEIILDDDGTSVRLRGSLSPLESARVSGPSRGVPMLAVLRLLWAWGIPCLAIYLFLVACFQSDGHGLAPKPIWLLSIWLFWISWGASLGISSALFALWNITCGQPTTAYVILECGFWLGILAFGWCWKSSKGRVTVQSDTSSAIAEREPEPRIAFVPLLIVLGLLLVVMTWEFLVWNDRAQHGINDSTTIWNLRARFLFRSPGEWRDAFSPAIWHADYPLLLPASIARAWFFMGGEYVPVPAFIGFSFYVALMMVLVSSLWMLRGPTVACLMGIVTLSEPGTLVHTLSQIADIPFTYFLAVTVTSWVFAFRWSAIERSAWLVTGLSLGGGLWLKNEGLTWATAAILLIAAFSRPYWSMRRWTSLAMGLAPFLVAWTIFHFTFHTSNDLISGQGASTLDRLCDPARYGQIFTYAAFQFLKIGPGLLPVLFFYAVLMGRARSDYCLKSLGPIVLIVGQSAVYFMAYVTSPNELAWHLSSSIDRLMLHLWPVSAWMMLLLVRTPSERSAYDALRDQERLAVEMAMRGS